MEKSLHSEEFTNPSPERINTLHKESKVRSTKNSPPKFFASPKKISPRKSPNKNSWLRAGDEELLQRLKAISIEGKSEEDESGNCMSEIVKILQDKLQVMLEEKINLKKMKQENTENLRVNSDENAKVKSELYTAEKALYKLIIANNKEKEEIDKLESKIQEEIEKMKNIQHNGAIFTKEEECKLRTGERFFEQKSKILQEKSDEDKAIIEALTKEENELERKLDEKTQECENLSSKINNLHENESNRQRTLFNVADTIEGGKSSKILK